MPIHPKVAASTLAAAIVAVVMWVLQDRGVVVSDNLVAGITALAGFVAGWLVPATTTAVPGVVAPTEPFVVTPQVPSG